MSNPQRKWLVVATILVLTGCSTPGNRAPSGDLPADPNLWLEEIESPAALEWAKAHNDKTIPRLTKDPRYAKIESEARQILLAQDRIPTPNYKHGYVYNFWQDQVHVRGIWRRVPLSKYKKNPPPWEIILDLDELARKESENWVWVGASCLPPKNERCLISLSRGGKDAVVIREFDISKKGFAASGFEIPEAKSSATWLDENQLLVGTDWGPGSLTTSGYSRLIKLWKRGTPLSSAELIYEAEAEDMVAGVAVYVRAKEKLAVITRLKTFYKSDVFILDQNLKPTRIPKPDDAIFVGVLDGKLITQLRSAWELNGKRYPEGALLSIDRTELSGQVHPKLIFAPDAKSSVKHVATTRDSLYVSILQNVNGKVFQFKPSPEGEWQSTLVPLPENGTVSILSADPLDDSIFLSYESFLIPQTVYLARDRLKQRTPKPVQKAPARFESRGMLTEQFEAISKDGTKVPYFVVRRNGIAMNGSNPTLLYGYGGFEVSQAPNYLQAIGKVWLEKGGIYALANIRGGGEFGPKWHEAALKENRQKAFDDFAAVAEDLIRRGLTSSKHLGIMGESNGGLLMGATFVQRPELFKAVVCKVPLLDMLRYHKLLAGASWMAEYGNPDEPAMRDVILKYSPYQNVRPDVKYPRVFFETSTKDDRVHPGHARKMVAKMESQGHEVLYFENIEGGHSAAANLEQRIRRYALEYTYLFQELAD